MNARAFGGKVCEVCVGKCAVCMGGKYVKCAREVCGVWRVRDECVGSAECL